MSASLRNIDLNLLFALDALLQERNVTRAGERLCISQPAMSASLGKLRRHFNDQLLERQGLRYVLTPLGVTLRDQVAETLRWAQRTFDTQRDFDPADSEREFHLIASDYAQAVLGGHLIRLADSEAPQVRLRFENVSVRTVDDLESRMGGIDALLLPTGFVEGFPHFELFRDEWVCVAWSGNDEIGEGAALDVLRESRRISTFDTGRTFTYADRQLDILDFRRSSVVADGFLATPFLLTGTRSVALLPRRIAELTREPAALRILPVHLDAPPLIESVWWHEAHNADPGHRWLRRLLRRAAGELALSGDPPAPSAA